jgi:peptidoglycan/LPS O-acetylase OafA/YrhL
MTKSFSLYLDLLRFFAAFCVLISHANSRDVVTTKLVPYSLGHNAVIIFFLLSGYVIAFVTDTKEKTAREYWLSRLSRIYSVAVPAVLLTLGFDLLGEMINPDFYAGNVTTHDYWYVRVAASLTFTNELWFVAIMPFSNSAYWSLCYEMTYYLLFSIYCHGGRHRYGLLFLAAMVIGPKILLLAPIWIAGVVLYRNDRWYQISRFTGAVLWVLSIVAIIGFQALDLGHGIAQWTHQLLGDTLHTQLNFSKHFLGDYLLTILVAINFIGFRRIAEEFDGLFKIISRPIRWLSSYTFSLYLYHLPILLFFVAIIDGDPNGYGFVCSALACTLVTVFVLGAVTEQQRAPLKQWLSSVFDALRRKNFFPAGPSIKS